MFVLFSVANNEKVTRKKHFSVLNQSVGMMQVQIVYNESASKEEMSSRERLSIQSHCACHKHTNQEIKNTDSDEKGRQRRSENRYFF